MVFLLIKINMQNEFDVSPLLYITQWFITFFTGPLPWPTVLRVWDILYFDGIKAFFRVSLGILKSCKSTSMFWLNRDSGDTGVSRLDGIIRIHPPRPRKVLDDGSIDEIYTWNQTHTPRHRKVDEKGGTTRINEKIDLLLLQSPPSIDKSA
jgi:hypothetical protein